MGDSVQAAESDSFWGGNTMNRRPCSIVSFHMPFAPERLPQMRAVPYGSLSRANCFVVFVHLDLLGSDRTGLLVDILHRIVRHDLHLVGDLGLKALFKVVCILATKGV